EGIRPPAGPPVRHDQARLARRIRGPVMLLLLGAGAGIAVLAGLLYFFRSAPTALTSAAQPSAATRPAASAPSTHIRASPTPRSAAPLTSSKWLDGLTALQEHMNNAGPATCVTLTPQALPVMATQLP